MKQSLLAVLALPLILSMVTLASPTPQNNQPAGAVSQKGIDRIIKEAEHMADSDRSQREMIDLQNKLVSLVKNTQRTFLEFGGLLEKEQQEAGQRILSEGEAALKSDEMGELRMSIDAVERLGRQLTTAMMKQPAEDNKKED